jgi:hypothetical protein
VRPQSTLYIGNHSQKIVKLVLVSPNVLTWREALDLYLKRPNGKLPSRGKHAERGRDSIADNIEKMRDKWRRQIKELDMSGTL